MKLLSNNKINYINNKDLSKNKTNQKQVSFKCSPTRIIRAVSSAMDGSKIFTSYSQKFDSVSTMNAIRNRIGTSADVLFEHVKSDDIIRSSVIVEGDKIQFKNKKPIRLLIDGILYPIAKIPFYILYGGINQLKKIKAFKNSDLLKRFESSSFYKFTHSYLKKDDKLYALQGLMEVGAQKNVLGGKARQKEFLHSTAKTFDSKFGNYNGVHERALTRIVTGFIPAFFLASDAHNLSIMCDNNKKEAQKEKNLRFQQESRRVLSNAYIQLITLGALSKFINKSKGWFVGITMGTVLLTEIYSRLKTGKKIHFISAEEAKQINAKEKMQKAQANINKGLSFTIEESTSPFNVSMNGVNKFIQNPNSNKFRDIITPKPKAQNNNKEKTRALISLGTFVKAAASIIVAGFALKGLKKVPLGGQKHVSDIFDYVSKTYQKIYNKITMKPNYIQKDDMAAIFEKMKNCGFGTLATSYEKVVHSYQKMIEIPKHIGEEFIEALKKSGNDELAKYVEVLKSGKNQKQLLSSLKKEMINRNFKVLLKYIEKSGREDLVEKIAEINKDGSINYSKLHKLFAKSENEKYKEIFENVFAVDDNTLKQGLISRAKAVLINSNQREIWQTVEDKANSVLNARTYYDLGKTKRPFVKDMFDFCLEPFKFFWGFCTSPYKIIHKVMNLSKVTPRKGMNDMDVVAKALNSLNKKVSMNDELFTDMFNEKIVKGFNSTSMSKISNSELSSLAKTASTIATMSFLISDNYNMVMLKSNGENEEEAKLKGKERFVQEMSRFLWQQMFINMFNNSFASTYNASLLGASIVNAASTYATETCTRKAVGIPIKSVSREEIIQLEKDNLEGDGLKSKFFRFMSKLTGKQVISERETKKK